MWSSVVSDGRSSRRLSAQIGSGRTDNEHESRKSVLQVASEYRETRLLTATYTSLVAAEMDTHEAARAGQRQLVGSAKAAITAPIHQ